LINDRNLFGCMLVSGLVSALLFCIAVTVHFVSLPHSANQPYVLWSSWENTASVCCNGYFGKVSWCPLHCIRFICNWC